jgi:hypothetical protein
MNTFLALILLALAVLSATVLTVAGANGFHRSASPVRAFLAFAFHAPLGFVNALRGGAPLALANVAEGQSLTGLKTYISDSTFGTRYRLGKTGSAATNVAIINAATDKPRSVVIDEGVAGDAVSCAILGATVGTLKIALNSTVAEGDTLTPDATGYGRVLPTADGTYWIFGTALQAGVAGDVIEFAPCPPRQIAYLSAVATSRL